MINLQDLSVLNFAPKKYRKGKDRALLFNSFTANVADRRRHSRLPTSPIGDFDPLI